MIVLYGPNHRQNRPKLAVQMLNLAQNLIKRRKRRNQSARNLSEKRRKKAIARRKTRKRRRGRAQKMKIMKRAKKEQNLLKRRRNANLPKSLKKLKKINQLRKKETKLKGKVYLKSYQRASENRFRVSLGAMKLRKLLLNGRRQPNKLQIMAKV